MNYINKKTLITLIFLVSLVQLSHGNIFSKNFESDHLISTSKTLSTGNFYDNYQTNWKNVKKYKTGYFWNRAKPTTIKTAASATSNSLDDKQSYISANGYSPKTKNKVSFSGDSNKSFTNSSSACSPETPLEITEGSGWGISRSTLNNSGVPSFCLNISKNAPSPNEVFNTTLDPNSDISFNNSNYTKAQIRELVQRTVAVITHPNYAPSNLPTGLMSNFYRSIQSTVWHWTNNTNINNNYSWTASNGNTYDADDLKGWVSNGTLIATDVFWLVPNNSNTQPEILLNQTSRPATIVTNVTICSNSTYKWSVNGVTYNGSAGNKSVTVQGNTTVNSQGVTCAANKTLNLTVTPQVTAVNSTTTTAIAENHTKTLVGSPSGGTWSVVSGGGTISGTTYTPADISINTNVTVKYTIPANGGCSATTSSVTFTVTPMVDPCDAVASGNLDTDKDGVSDICDLDDDNDGILDTDESCSPRYASFESDINDVNNKHNAEGAADGNYAEIYNNNQQLILDLGQVFPSGTQYQITWRKKSNASGTAVIDLSESTSPNSGFINHPTSPQTSTSGSFITTTVTANVNFRYIAFNKGNSSTTDYDLDAVGIICLPSDTDKDGIIDSLDTDSDNDGCPDAFEGAANLTTTATLNGGSNGGSSANLGTTVNSNGIPTAAATSTITGQNTTNAVKTAEQITVVTAPANTGAVTGTNATLTVSATASKTTTYSSGTPNYNSGSSSTNTLTYKWYKNSAPNTILATTSSLTLNNVTAANAGDYTVKIIGTNNKCGVTRTATLTICPAITNSTTTTSITEDQTKTLAGSPTGGTFSI
ncbi:thrombospondin type 3 repeat-containing protein, partial [Polaribacter glomeratus]